MEHPVLKEAENFDKRFPKLVKTLDNFEKIIDIEQLRRKYFSNKDKKGKDYFREIITEFYDQERENVES